MDTFFAIPTSSSVSFSPIIIDNVSPIIGTTTFINPLPVMSYDPLFPVVSITQSNLIPTLIPTVTSAFNPNSSTFYYYDSGVGSSPLAQHETNEFLRYKFLDKELVSEHKDILAMLKVDGDIVSVVKDGKGDVGSSSDVTKKVDFIGNNILTRSKNLKILKKIIQKNYHIKFYDLPHNLDLVFSTQAKYIKQHLREMR
jgi:hypothetical protein